MKKNIYWLGLLLTTVLLMLQACDKNNEDGLSVNYARVVKYEIAGNYTGKLAVVYNDNVSCNTVLNNVSVLWSKEVTYSQSVTGIGIGAQASMTGILGQTATLKIYVNGTEVKRSSGSAGSSGELILPTIAYIF
ncbi:hypothetical protein [Ferruginibacter sp.]|nr:hypothetical protein [Ferruginibacter sp.]